VVTGMQAEGSLIPEAVAMETATEETTVVTLVVGVTEGQPPSRKLQ
jgi:hypothetical protein